MIDARMFREVDSGGRNVDIVYEIGKRAWRVFDRDYQVELDPMHDDALERAVSAGWRAFKSFVDSAIREPTSLEILYYAQIGGPHVRGEA